MSGKIRYDTLVLELFGVVISQLYAQLILKTNLSNNNLTVILSLKLFRRAKIIKLISRSFRK